MLRKLDSFSLPLRIFFSACTVFTSDHPQPLLIKKEKWFSPLIKGEPERVVCAAAKFQISLAGFELILLKHYRLCFAHAHSTFFHAAMIYKKGTTEDAGYCILLKREKPLCRQLWCSRLCPLNAIHGTGNSCSLSKSYFDQLRIQSPDQ